MESLNNAISFIHKYLVENNNVIYAGQATGVSALRWFQFVANQPFHGCCVQSQLLLVLLS